MRKVFVTVPGNMTNSTSAFTRSSEDVARNSSRKSVAVKKGALFSRSRSNLFGRFSVTIWKNYKQTTIPKVNPPMKQKERVIAFAKFVTKADDAEFAKSFGISRSRQLARYMALTTWLVDMDGILA